eukprot:2401083-Amphidinium_carterae.2
MLANPHSTCKSRCHIRRWSWIQLIQHMLSELANAIHVAFAHHFLKRCSAIISFPLVSIVDPTRMPGQPTEQRDSLRYLRTLMTCQCLQLHVVPQCSGQTFKTLYSYLNMSLRSMTAASPMPHKRWSAPRLLYLPAEQLQSRLLI